MQEVLLNSDQKHGRQSKILMQVDEDFVPPFREGLSLPCPRQLELKPFSAAADWIFMKIFPSFRLSTQPSYLLLSPSSSTDCRMGKHRYRSGGVTKVAG